MNLHYHYCSMDSFFSIITNKELWLPSLVSTKDKNECKTSYSYANKETPQEYIEKMISEIYYISFTSNKDDYLHFNTYGDSFKGISIGIDVQVFKELVSDSIYYPSLNDLFIFEPIIYKKKRQKRKFDDYEKRLKDNSLKDMIGSRGIVFSKAEDILAPLFKDINFENEKETRLLFYANSYHRINNTLMKRMKQIKENNSPMDEMSNLERKKYIYENYDKFSRDERDYSLYLDVKQLKDKLLKDQNNIYKYVSYNKTIKKITSLNISYLLKNNFIKELCIGPLSEQTIDELKWFLESNDIETKNIEIYKSTIKLI